MRILYKESPAGITCLISIPEAEAAHLEGPLKVKIPLAKILKIDGRNPNLYLLIPFLLKSN